MEKQSLRVNTTARQFIIDTTTIIRVEASFNYSKLFFSDGKMLVTAKLLRWFEERLQPSSFTRLHRSHLINNNFLQANQCISKQAKLKDGNNIPISKRRKKLVLQKLAAACLLFFITSLSAFSQNVGIGTTTPSFPLDVRTTDDGTIMRLRTAKDSTGATTLLRFTTASNLFTAGDKSSFIGNLRSGAGHNLIFGTSENSQSVLEKMRLNYRGFLGIGTVDPTARLYIDMSNTSDDNALIINDDEDPLVELRRNDIGLGFWQLTGNDVKIGTTLNNNLGNMILRTNGADRLMVSPTGDVRMGDLSLNYLRFSGNEIQSFNNGISTEMILQQNGGKLEVGNITDPAITKLQINNGVDVGLPDVSSGYLMLGLSSGVNIVADNNEIQARNNGDASNMYLQNGGGNVWIGNAAFNSTSRLGVTGSAEITGNLQLGNRTTPAGFKLSVDGKMICTEVMVKLLAWPDYVFSGNHPLLPLSQLEQYILQNKRLPGIPAAPYIEKNGLGLGEMQRLQMEKIEELTLYIIELKKEIEQLKQNR